MPYAIVIALASTALPSELTGGGFERRSPSRSLICILFGHDDDEVTLQLGKVTAEPVKVFKCARCGRISIPKSELGY